MRLNEKCQQRKAEKIFLACIFAAVVIYFEWKYFFSKNGKRFCNENHGHRKRFSLAVIFIRNLFSTSAFRVPKWQKINLKKWCNSANVFKADISE